MKGRESAGGSGGACAGGQRRQPLGEAGAKGGDAGLVLSQDHGIRPAWRVYPNAWLGSVLPVQKSGPGKHGPCRQPKGLEPGSAARPEAENTAATALNKAARKHEPAQSHGSAFVPFFTTPSFHHVVKRFLLRARIPWLRYIYLSSATCNSL